MCMIYSESLSLILLGGLRKGLLSEATSFFGRVSAAKYFLDINMRAEHRAADFRKKRFLKFSSPSDPRIQELTSPSEIDQTLLLSSLLVLTRCSLNRGSLDWQRWRGS